MAVVTIAAVAWSESMLSYTARTLERWVRIQLEACKRIGVVYVPELSCVDRGLAIDRSPIQGVLLNFCK
jgi:hypothetical protein